MQALDLSEQMRIASLASQQRAKLKYMARPILSIQRPLSASVSIEQFALLIVSAVEETSRSHYFLFIEIFAPFLIKCLFG